MIKSEYQILSRKIEETKKQIKVVRDGIDTLSGDLTVDRQDIDDLKRKQVEIEASLKSVLDTLKRIEQDQKATIERVVTETLDRQMQPIKETLESFVKSKSKILVVREKFNIFTRLYRYFKGQKDELVKEIQKEVNEK